jgi:hypothetical protein
MKTGSPRLYSLTRPSKDREANLQKPASDAGFSRGWFGFVWFGSSGLSRFPGRRFEVDGRDGDGKKGWRHGTMRCIHGSDLDWSCLSLSISFLSLFPFISFVPPHHRRPRCIRGQGPAESWSRDWAGHEERGNGTQASHGLVWVWVWMGMA